MAVSLSKSTPVLLFNSDNPFGKFHKIKFLVWPAYAFRVSVPSPKQVRLNLFQKYTLALLRSGMDDSKEIARYLGWDRELADHIIQQLYTYGLISEQNLLTSTGEQFSTKDALCLTEITSGYIFQNAFDGKFWPRFVTQLEFADVEYDEKHRVILLFGNASNPWRERPFRMISEQLPTYSTPQSSEIMNICAEYWQTQSLDFVYDTRTLANQFSLVSPTPVPYLLATYCYKTTQQKKYLVYDPFGFGPSEYLQEILNIEFSKDENLQTFLQDSSEEERKDIETSIPNSVVCGEVLQKFAKSILVHHELAIALQNLEMAKIAWQKSASSFLASEDKDLPIKCRIVWQEIFHYLGIFPVQPDWAKRGFLQWDDEHNAILLEQMAKKIGFHLTKEGTLPEIFRYIKFSKIKYTSRVQIGSLVDMVQVIILKAYGFKSHPLYTIASLYPDFLLQLAQWIELDCQDITRISSSTILEEIDNIYQIISLLFL